jgi:hypothetical protein
VKRPRVALVVTLALALAALVPLPASPQDTTTLEGEAAIRLMAGHGHLFNYCEGQLWITPTRLRFDSSLGSKHSFDLRRADVKDFHAGDSFGFHYMKLATSQRTYRLGLYPNLEGALGDRFALAEHAWRDFPAAVAEVERAGSSQNASLLAVTATMENGQPVLEFPAFVGPQFLWFRGPEGVTLWAKPEAGGEAYGKIMGANAAGKLRVSAARIAFIPADAAANAKFGFDYPRDEVKLYSGAGGYPRVVVNTRHGGRVSIVLGETQGSALRLYDVALLLRVLGAEFSEAAGEVVARQK